ncbi:MAG: SDR family oxidoreductase [Planctomycetota bacterium]|jgi:NADP-dependent 3-hydroxy acid dehydrogenase YdfG
MLKGKGVLITGGGSGMGLATAALFLKEGAKVVIAGRNAAKLAEAVKFLNGGERLFTHVADVAVAEQAEGLIAAAVKLLGQIDILVNNAGTNLKERTFRELNPERWRSVMGANLDGAFYCIHFALPAMLERKEGLIVNINSVAGLRASPLGGVAYAASKFGMTALGIGLHAEEKDSGIRVTNIYPGEVDTPILEFRPQPISEDHRARILKPDDIARAVVFVASQPAHVSIPELIIKPTVQSYV